MGIFDRDEPNIIKLHKDEVNQIKKWGENVYSFCIPEISTRNFENICIEHYYTDEEIKTFDTNNRRLFLGTEFFESLNDKGGLFQTKEKNKCNKNSIIDNNVFENTDLEHSKNIALSKNDFAENIINGVDGFNNFNLDNFKLILDIIEKIENPTLAE